MKTWMVTLTCLFLFGAVAHAGYQGWFPVTADSTSRYGMGSMGYAHGSNNAVEGIGCYAYVDGSSTTPYWVGQCFATDANSKSVSCFFSGSGANNEAMAKVILGLSSDSTVTFNYNASGVCTAVKTYTHSMFPTK